MAGILECWCVISSHHVAFVLFSHSLWSKCLAVVNVGWSIILEGPRSIGQKSAGWDIQNRASEFRFPCCGRPQCIPQSVFLLCRDSSSLWYSLIYNSFRDSLQQTPKTLKQKHIEIIEIPLWRALTWSAMKCHEVPWSAMKCTWAQCWMGPEVESLRQQVKFSDEVSGLRAESWPAIGPDHQR